jgi:hypothetical protein
MPRCACLLGSHLTRSKTTANGKMAVPYLSNYARSQHACAVMHCFGTERFVTEMSFTCYQRLSGRPTSISSILFQSVGPRQDNADPRQGPQDRMLSASSLQSELCLCYPPSSMRLYLLCMGMRNIRRHVKCCCGVLGFPSPSPHGKEHVTTM